MPKGGRPSASLTSGSCSQASFFRDSGNRKGASLSGTRRSGAVPFSFLSKFCRSRASADARSPQGIIRSTMSVKSREKIALAVFAALIVLSLLGLGWYLVAGHSWNVAASNIDDTFGSMDGYTAIVYEGTAVPQTRRRRKRRRRKKPRRGLLARLLRTRRGRTSSILPPMTTKGSHPSARNPDGKRTSGSFPKRMLLRRRSKRNRMRARRRERAREPRAARRPALAR